MLARTVLVSLQPIGRDADTRDESARSVTGSTCCRSVQFSLVQFISCLRTAAHALCHKHLDYHIPQRSLSATLATRPQVSVTFLSTVICTVLQQNRLRWYGHVLRKDDDDWVKKCMEYEVEGPRPRGRAKRTWREVVREDRQARKLNAEEDAVDRSKWTKMIKDVR